MPVIVVAKDYIKKVKEEQNHLPPGQKKIVPSAEEMADYAQVGRAAIYAFLNREKHRRIDIAIVDGIIKAFRDYGHNTQLEDVIRYVDE